MIKKSESYFWKEKNHQKIGSKIYYDNNRIKRTKFTFLGVPFYIDDKVLEIKQDYKYW
ncbi:hypothetical protein D1872_296910 [compost metagenome]